MRESQIEPWLAHCLEASDATERRGCSNLEVSMESNNAPANRSRGRSQGLDVREHPRRTREKCFSLDVPFYRTRPFHGTVGFIILTKDELIHALQNEVRILLHLISKVDPATLDYRLSPKQRSLLELLQYLVFMPEVHMRAALADSFSLAGFQTAWQAGDATAKAMNLAQITEAIGRQRALIEELLSPCSDADLRAQIEMFGNKASRGSMLVLLVLSHYAAYRMQLFLYLKATGRAELSTFNLWVGADALA